VTTGTLPAGLTLNTSTGVITGTPAAQGVATFTITATNAFGTGSVQLSLTVNSPPSITTISPLTAAQAGAAYSQTLAASGSTPVTWAVTGGALPAGLTLSASTGVISGTPTALGAFTFTVSATNAFGASSVPFTLTVNSAPSITTASPLPAAQTGTAYSQTLAASGSTPITWTVTAGSLPTGLTLNTSTGVISGTSTALGVATFTVTAANAFGTNPEQLSLTVYALPTITTASTLPAAQSGIAYSQTLTASGSAPLTWGVTSGALPAGLALNTSTGVISGTPTAVGVAAFSVTATNAFGSGSEPLSLTVNVPVGVTLGPATVTLSPSQTQTFTASVSNNSNIGVTWSLSPAVGTISTSGDTAVYTAPNIVNLNQNVQITATSMADSTKFAQAVISLLSAVTVSVAPAAITLNESQNQTYTATVTGASTPAVTWSLSPQMGTVSAAGVYSAPASLSDVETVQVIAQSVANPSKSGRVPVTLRPTNFTISVSPASVSLTASQTQNFSATIAGISDSVVTWSLNPAVGTISNTGLYTAPATIASSQTVTVTAASFANPNKSATASIILYPPVTVTVSPTSSTLAQSQTETFSATVANTSNTGVTWSVNPAVGTISPAGLYSAPESIASLQVVTVTATSVANTSASGSATLTLNPATLQTLGTFNLTDQFGVAWPDQPIEFRYDKGQPPIGTTRMLGPAGIEVPYQWVSSCSDTTATKGCIAVRSSFPAYGNYTWTLQSGVAPTASQVNPVQFTQTGSYYQITNGLTGVRVVTAAGNPSPYNLAPIQGIQLANGSWTGVGASPNLLYTESVGLAGNMGEPLHTPAYTVTGYSVVVVDAGPMKTVIQASYTFNRPEYYYGSTTLQTPGPGHYTVTFTLYANSKTVLVDEDSDTQFSYYIPLINQLTPDTARWKGHDSLDNTGTPNPLCGYDAPLTVSGATQSSPVVITASASLPANGERVLISGVTGNTAANGLYYAKTSGYPASQFGLYTDAALSQPVAGNGTYAGGGTVKPAYQGWSEADPAYDAFQDLTYTSDMPASYNCTPGSSHHKLLTDYPSAEHAAGWYFEFYQISAGAASPVVGMFSGDFSKDWFSATGPALPGPYTSNSHWITGAQAAGIQVDNLLRGPANTYVTAAHNYAVHRNWGIFVSTNADILSSTSHQPIQNEQNLLTGINLSRLYTYQLSYPDPPGGWTWLYLSPSSANQLISWVQNGTSVCGSVNCYYNLLYNSETSTWGRTLLNMWQGNSTAAVQTALNGAISLAQRILQMLAAGDNHFDDALGYYQLGLQTSPETAVINAILMDSNTTPAQKATAKAALALFGSLFWDDDWFPIDNTTGESDGLSNQIEQYLQYRTQSAAAASSQPFLAAEVSTALTYPTNDFGEYFSPTGAAAGSTHYQGTFFQPLILNYLNLVKDGSLSTLARAHRAHGAGDAHLSAHAEDDARPASLAGARLRQSAGA
jgi:hypothetical protein